MGRTLTVLILFLLTIVVIVVIFAFFTGLISFASGSHNVTISGDLVLDSSNSSAATLAVDISNQGTSLVTGVTFVCPASYFALTTCGNLPVGDAGGLISPENPMQKGDSAGASGLVALAPGTNISPGTQIVVQAVVTFADGTVATYTVTVGTYA